MKKEIYNKTQTIDKDSTIKVKEKFGINFKKKGVGSRFKCLCLPVI